VLETPGVLDRRCRLDSTFPRCPAIAVLGLGYAISCSHLIPTAEANIRPHLVRSSMRRSTEAVSAARGIGCGAVRPAICRIGLGERMRSGVVDGRAGSSAAGETDIYQRLGFRDSNFGSACAGYTGGAAVKKTRQF
jgi:hypothetical protein